MVSYSFFVMMNGLPFTHNLEIPMDIRDSTDEVSQIGLSDIAVLFYLHTYNYPNPLPSL